MAEVTKRIQRYRPDVFLKVFDRMDAYDKEGVIKLFRGG